MKRKSSPPPFGLIGFTLVELLVSMAILSLLLVVLVTITNQTSKTWRYTSSKIEQFRESRASFETMTRRIGQATLNTYWDYVYSGTLPTAYTRQSDLRFVSGNLEGGPSPLLAGVTFQPGGSGMKPIHPTHGVFFQAPLGYVAPASASDPTYATLRGMDNLLNTWGYYVEVNDDQGAGSRPGIFPSTSAPPLRIRSRLMELMLPANDPTTPSLSIYNWTLPAVATGSSVSNNWFTGLMSATPAAGYYHVLAENVIALIILPKLSQEDQASLSYTDSTLAPNYNYSSDTTGANTGPTQKLTNSKNQLPPIVQVTMVAIDEPSAILAMANETQAETFINTALNLPNLFKDASAYTSDLQAPANALSSSLESQLILHNVNYRIFTTNVSIRAAKWSQAAIK